MLTADDLAKPLEVHVQPNPRIEAFDIFGTANFLNFMPWTASLEYLLDRGIDSIAEYDQSLVNRFLDGLDRNSCTMISPAEPVRRSTLVLLRHVEQSRTEKAFAALNRAGIHGAMRAGSIRVSPHFYNSAGDIDSAVRVLNSI
jgi:cysteine desulfurase / selenocysteine lyase